MKAILLSITMLFCVVAYLATAAEPQHPKDGSVLNFQSAAEVRAYFSDLANTETDAELLAKYHQLLKDVGVAPLISKGTTVPIRNGGQLIVGREPLLLRNKNGETNALPQNGPAVATLSGSGSWSNIQIPNETESILIQFESGLIIVDLEDGIVSRLDTDHSR